MTPALIENNDEVTDFDDCRIKKIQALIYPQLLLEEIPTSHEAREVVVKTRRAVADVLHGRDDRLVVVVGPCSIHDPKSAIEYAQRLHGEVARFAAELLVIMRVYFEKPRTTVGWKGLINDPFLDESFKINTGLRVARKLLSDINDIGLPVGCEYLDTMMPQYTADLTSWAAIGARTTECQLHRELSSGLSMPVGFKNGTGGDTQIAVDACRASSCPHTFLGITKQGLPAICHSSGNVDCHMILRGGASGPNYEAAHINAATALMEAHKCNAKLIVDCSHGNSMKDHKRQLLVVDDLATQVGGGNLNIAGVMIESHLFEGAQSLPPPRQLEGGANLDGSAKALGVLRYGVSITDKCVSWTDTVDMLEKLAAAVRKRRETRK